MNNTLEVSLVSKQYGKVKAVNQISFTLNNGVYGLIGHNGAGKSTLIRMLALLEKPDQGEIKYNDECIQTMQNKYRNILGVMPQNQQGYDHFSGIQFLYYMATLKGISRKDAKLQIPELVKQVNLDDAIERKIKTYSGGMRQRIMLAQALLGNPKILIMDEPTAGLDPYERIRIRNLVAKLASDKIVLLATHVMQDIEPIANGLIFMKDGILVFYGTNEEIIERLDQQVFEASVTKEILDEYQQQYLISRITKIDEAYNIRYITNEKKENSVKANLEDVYLYYMGQKC